MDGFRTKSPAHRWAVADESGAPAVEFALVMPMLLLLMLGIFKLGVAFNNYIQLTNAAAAGARQLTISRGSATPYSGTISAIRAAAPNLGSSKITATLTVNGVSCTSDGTACQNAFGNGATLVSAQASLSYPCDLVIFTAGVSSCTLQAASTGAVE